MRKLFPWLDRAVDRAGYWQPVLQWIWGLLGGSVVMTALGAFWEVVASQGWAAIVIFGIFSACGIALVGSLAALLAATAYRRFSPGPTLTLASPSALSPDALPPTSSSTAAGQAATSSTLTVDQLYVGLVRADIAKAESHRQIEFFVHCYNGSTKIILIREISGKIVTNLRPSPPIVTSEISSVWLTDWKNMNGIEPRREFYLSIQCRIDDNLQTAIQTLETGKSLSFDLEQLHIGVQPVDDREHVVRLPLWDGVSVLRDAGRFHSVQEKHLRVAAIPARKS